MTSAIAEAKLHFELTRCLRKETSVAEAKAHVGTYSSIDDTGN